jgi:hypothetical protein
MQGDILRGLSHVVDCETKYPRETEGEGEEWEMTMDNGMWMKAELASAAVTKTIGNDWYVITFLI